MIYTLFCIIFQTAIIQPAFALGDGESITGKRPREETAVTSNRSEASDSSEENAGDESTNKKMKTSHTQGHTTHQHHTINEAPRDDSSSSFFPPLSQNETIVNQIYQYLLSNFQYFNSAKAALNDSRDEDLGEVITQLLNLKALTKVQWDQLTGALVNLGNKQRSKIHRNLIQRVHSLDAEADVEQLTLSSSSSSSSSATFSAAASCQNSLVQMSSMPLTDSFMFHHHVVNAVLGSKNSQLWLAKAYYTGNEVPLNYQNKTIAAKLCSNVLSAASKKVSK